MANENPHAATAMDPDSGESRLDSASKVAVDASSGSERLLSDRSFWSLLVTQFLGAFNDNVYKQIVLLLAVPVSLAAAVATTPPSGLDRGQDRAAVVAVEGAEGERAEGEGAEGEGAEGAIETEVVEEISNDSQGWVTAIFSLPFVLFSGFAGFLSDKFSKRRIIVLAKVAEIAVMLLGLLAFWSYGFSGWIGLWFVLLMMGLQSTFFGPGKYGILPELFRKENLPRANGLILMTTFLAIIFGTVIAGKMVDAFVIETNDGMRSASGLWIASLICVAIAVAGTISSMLIRPTRPSTPDAKLTVDDWGISKAMRSLLIKDRPLLLALLVSCVFWLVSGITVPVVNRLGLSELKLDKANTSYLVACIGLGIMVGAIAANRLLKRLSPKTQVSIGLFGIAGVLILLGFAKTGQTTIFGFGMCCFLLMGMGIFAAIFSIPIQVFLQDRPPSTLKGRMIATMNQANFVGIMLSGPIYQLFESISGSLNQPITVVFWMMAGLVLPLAIFYRPFADRKAVLA
jgi:acyl-[acyl-carrier-protein]-phospholipid O-acyltransferase/long-chain-fatty-acid--[acyl-carrier-protein] ligase